MSAFMDKVFTLAAADRKTIVLPEGSDARTQKAALKIAEAGFAEVIVLGSREKLLTEASELERVQILDPANDPLSSVLADELYQARKHKGMTPEDAAKLIEDELYFGVMLVKTGRADGMVAGACHSTADVLRPSLQILKTAPGSALVSSFFVIIVPDCDYGDHGTFIFSDCGLNVNPDAEGLANIALSSAKSWKTLIGTTPYVALLSHSSKGSATNDDADKVVCATKTAHELDDSIAVDGELQVDAALCPEVAALKCPHSPVAGKANVLVFPDLDAGNAGYKLVQRLAKAEAYGPITQGLACPVNDLSRGCSVDDIVGVTAITCLQAQQR